MCKRLDDFGATVYAFSRTEESLLQLSKECKRLVPITVDLGIWKDTVAAFQQLKGVAVHGLVNNAGIAIIKPFAKLTENDFDEYEMVMGCF